MFQDQMHRSIHNDRIREMRIRTAQAQRQDAARAWHAAQGTTPRSVRRSIGRSIVRVGQAIASEPQPLRSTNRPPVASS